MKYLCTFSIVLNLLITTFAFSQDEIRIGSKLFNESVILGEIAMQLIESKGFETEYIDQLGGTRILWNAILEGEIDVYPDYTGTLIFEILSKTENLDHADLNEALLPFGVQVTAPLGFNNTYALGVNKKLAEELNLKSISDLTAHHELEFGFSNEFIDRPDGWRGLKEAYNLPQSNVIGLDHELAYRGLENEDIDVIDLYSTDAEIDYYDLVVLEDDLGFFPKYEAVFVYRTDLPNSLIVELSELAGKISESKMIEMNAEVKLNGEEVISVAEGFLTDTFSISTERRPESLIERLSKNTLDHLFLVGVSLLLAILISIPLGIASTRYISLEQPILTIVGLLQTIPSLALLVFMIPLFGIGTVPAMAALFLYSLLPVVRNTHAGIKNIDPSLKESANALGIPTGLILKRIEIPLALPSILAGIKTSAVINVGTATLGALIGAGGYGQPILTGIRLDDVSLILEGAIPAALLAIIVQFFFDQIEKKITV